MIQCLTLNKTEFLKRINKKQCSSLPRRVKFIFDSIFQEGSGTSSHAIVLTNQCISKRINNQIQFEFI